jgi:hypothetical protein
MGALSPSRLMEIGSAGIKHLVRPAVFEQSKFMSTTNEGCCVDHISHAYNSVCLGVLCGGLGRACFVLAGTNVFCSAMVVFPLTLLLLLHCLCLC